MATIRVSPIDSMPVASLPTARQGPGAIVAVLCLLTLAGSGIAAAHR